MAEIRAVRSLPHGLFVVNLKYGKHISIPNGKGNKYQAKVLSVGKCCLISVGVQKRPLLKYLIIVLK